MLRKLLRRDFGRLAAFSTAGLTIVPSSQESNAKLSRVEPVDPQFADFIDRMGGVPVIGEALTPAFEHNGRYAQLFANFLLERRPNPEGTSYRIAPASLGKIVSGERYFKEIAPFRDTRSVKYIWQTRHSLRFGFLELWQRVGGASMLGYPISEEVPEAHGITAQFFECGKLTYMASRSQPVQIEAIGRAYLAAMNNWTNASYRVKPLAVQTPGDSTNVRLTVLNTGTTDWTTSGPDAVRAGIRWADSHLPSARTLPPLLSLPQAVAPGDSVDLSFHIQLPDVPGPYRIQPDLRIGDDWFSSRTVRAPIVDVPVQLEVPEIRVGLLDISDDNPGVNQATIFSTKGLQIRDEGHTLLAELKPFERAVIRRDIPNEVQTINLPNGSLILTVGKVLVAPQEESLLRLEETAPQRTYRGTMEFAWLPHFQSAWVVNTLPMDDYLAGIVEQGDHIPWEALRASAIAFRTYGYTVRDERRKRGNLFDVAASTRHTPTLYTRDQVYHGFARELSGTRLREAIHDTRGRVMTYEGRSIHAVYFSRADGRTRSWHDIWGGKVKPWALGVTDPYSTGHSLLGHGIGLPLRSANLMAAAGANGEQILRHYYTDVTFEHVY